jgi:hypothetical protein
MEDFIRSKTAAASESCGTHFGETKLVASTEGRPAAARAWIRANLTSVGTWNGEMEKKAREGR